VRLCLAGEPIWKSFCLQWQRAVNRDNTVSFENLHLQIDAARWRATLAGCTVTVHQYLDGTLSLHCGPHCVGRYDSRGLPHRDPSFYGAKQRKGNCPLPLQPHPQKQPHSRCEATTLNPIPDISLATKSGHFNLLTTIFFIWCIKKRGRFP